MSLHPSLRSDDDETLIDLVDDCREVSGVLAPYVPHTVSLPAPRDPATGEVALPIDEAAVAGLSGWGDYGA